MDKACFQHGTAYGDFSDLPKRTASVRVLHHKEFIIAKNPKYDERKHRIASMVYIFFTKRSSHGVATCARSEILATLDKSYQK